MPEDVSTEAAKVERFMEGLQQSLQYQLVVCEYRTFSDLVNKALMLEDKLVQWTTPVSAS